MSVKIAILKEIEPDIDGISEVTTVDIIGVLAPPSSVMQWNGTTYCPLSEVVSVSIH